MDARPKEGDIFDVIYMGGHSLVIRYGYYDESERGVTDPIPILPCFLTDPKHTEDGWPLVTRIQDACEYYTAREGAGDGWCADCIHCQYWQAEVGICKCPQRKQRKPQSAVKPQEEDLS